MVKSVDQSGCGLAGAPICGVGRLGWSRPWTPFEPPEGEVIKFIRGPTLAVVGSRATFNSTKPTVACESLD